MNTMKRSLIVLLTCFPLALLAQQLDCCKTVKDVETYLQGSWQHTSKLNKLSSYQFEGTDLVLQVYKINDDGEMEPPINGKSTVIVSKADKGFMIEYDFGPISTYFGIKYLDSLKLIIVRRDGKESTLYRIKE